MDHSTLRGLLVISLLLGVGAPRARADGDDIAGIWQVELGYQKWDCDGHPTGWTRRFVVVRDGTGYAIRNGHQSRIKVTASHDHDKPHLLLEEVYQPPFARPLHQRLELTGDHGRVSGTGVATATPVKGKRTCADPIAIAGSHTAATAADLAFDQAKATAEARGIVEDMARDCDLPGLTGRHTGKVRARVAIAADGGLASVSIDGASQHVVKTCGDLTARARDEGLDNPTGKRQVVELTLDLATLEVRLTAAELLALAVDPPPAPSVLADCVAELSDGGQDDPDPADAQRLCDARQEEIKGTRDLIDAARGLIESYRDYFNHDHAANLPETLRDIRASHDLCMKALDSQQWCHNVECTIQPAENNAFCLEEAAHLAGAL